MNYVNAALWGTIKKKPGAGSEKEKKLSLFYMTVCYMLFPGVVKVKERMARQEALKVQLTVRLIWYLNINTLLPSLDLLHPANLPLQHLYILYHNNRHHLLGR